MVTVDEQGTRTVNQRAMPDINLLALVLGAGRAEALIDTVWSVERVANARKLSALLRT